MKLFAARHGETTWNVEKRILGNTPGELTTKGIEQGRELAEDVSTLEIAAGYVSDLSRAVETANIVAERLPALIFKRSALLRERDFGELEGKLFVDVEWDKFWEQSPTSKEFGSESLQEFTNRIARFILTLENNNAGLLIITHSGVMNRLNYLSDPAHFMVINYGHAHANVFEYDQLVANSKLFLAGDISLL